MSGKAIGILLLLVAALAAVLYFTDEKVPVEQVAETSVLDGRSLTEAKRIRWQQRGHQPIEVGRDAEGRFVLKEPIQDLASAAFLRQIVVAWDSAQMHVVPFDDDEAGRQKAGLAEPELTMIVEWPDEKRIEVEVGKEGPLGDTRFLRREGRIWEGGNALLESMRVNLEDLRERGVFRNRPPQATELIVDQLLPSGRRETLHLKLEDREWQLLSPVTGRADPGGAQQFVTAVLSLRADYFQPGVVRRPERVGDIRIEVRGSAGEERCELWLEEGQLWGLMPGRDVLFVTENRQYVSVFQNSADRLRARILVPRGDTVFEELAELVIDPGQDRGDRLRFVRDDQKWRLVEPVEYAVHPTPMNEALSALGRLIAREFVSDDGGVRPRADDERYGLRGAERWTLSTRRVRDREASTLWLGAETRLDGVDEPMIYVARSDEPDNVAVVLGRPVDVLKRPWTEYVERQVVRQPAIVERLDLEHQDGRTRRFLVEDGEWRQVGDGAPSDPRPGVGEFANDVLRDLVGKRAVDMREGFGEPDWTLRMLRRNGDVLGLVKVWDRGADAPLVVKSRSEQPVGFELGTLDTRAMRELWQ